MFTHDDSDWDLNIFPIKETDPKRCIEKLKQIGEIRFFPKGEIVSKSGGGRDGCFIVLEGSVRTQLVTEDGIANQYINHSAGYAVLEAQCFCEWIELADFYAIEDTETIYVKREDLLTAMENDFELALYFIGTLCVKFRWYAERYRNRIMFGAMHRFCDLLIKMAHDNGEKKDDKTQLKKKVSQEEFARQLHVNRLTIIRCMKELRERGLVGTEDGFLSFPDLNNLEKFRNEV